MSGSVKKIKQKIKIMKKQPGILHYILKVYTVVCPRNHQKLAWLKNDIFLINFYFTFWTFNLKRHGATIVFIFVPPHLFEIFKLKITKNKAKPRISGGYILRTIYRIFANSIHSKKFSLWSKTLPYFCGNYMKFSTLSIQNRI